MANETLYANGNTESDALANERAQLPLFQRAIAVLGNALAAFGSAAQAADASPTAPAEGAAPMPSGGKLNRAFFDKFDTAPAGTKGLVRFYNEDGSVADSAVAIRPSDIPASLPAAPSATASAKGSVFLGSAATALTGAEPAGGGRAAIPASLTAVTGQARDTALNRLWDAPGGPPWFVTADNRWYATPASFTVPSMTRTTTALLRLVVSDADGAIREAWMPARALLPATGDGPWTTLDFPAAWAQPSRAQGSGFRLMVHSIDMF